MERESELRLLIAERVLQAYHANPPKIACLIDEQVDRSGNLLGWLRDLDLLLWKDEEIGHTVQNA